jgi:hypothetical protein
MLASALVVVILLPLTGNSFASTAGSVNEVVSNEKMQIYVIKAENLKFEQGDTVDVTLILKNLDDKPRAFNLFFAKVIDTDGNEWKASPLLGTIAPVHIPPNDILKGVLVFPLSNGKVTTFVWDEPDESTITIDLTHTKDPPDAMPKSDYILSSNKGQVVFDSRTQLTVNDELLHREPGFTYYIVDVSIKNLGKEPSSYNFAFFFVKDQDGNMYPTSLEYFQYLKNPLKKGNLDPNMEIRGEVLFPLPDTVTNVMLIYDEGFGTASYFAVPEFPMLLIPMILAFGLIMIFARIKKQYVLHS